MKESARSADTQWSLSGLGRNWFTNCQALPHDDYQPPSTLVSPSQTSIYCTISNCSAWPVTRDHCAEILLRQRPVWRVILVKFRQTKISAGHSQAWVLSECFVTAGQGQCDPWYTPISAPSKGPVTCDTPNNSKWYSMWCALRAHQEKPYYCQPDVCNSH